MGFIKTRHTVRIAFLFLAAIFAFSGNSQNPIVQNALNGRLPPGVSAADVSALSPAEVSQLENQAKSQGVPQSQIDALKREYRADKSTTAKTKQSNNSTEPSDAEFNPNAEPSNHHPTQNPTNQVCDTSGLSYFGYSIFQYTPDAFKPSVIGPVDPGYLVGPGDELRLSVWGEVELNYELSINSEGKILIPVVGQVYVAGTPFETLQEKIKTLLSRHYSGLVRNPPRTFMDLSVSKLRPVRIFIMGEVASPGGYTTSSYANAFNALYSIGGPTKKGSLRNITISRSGKQIGTADIYDYLLGGKCSTDVRLQNNDVIFIPPRGKTVAIAGSVFRPGIYELKDNEEFQCLLKHAGGVTTETNLDRAQVFRVVPFQDRIPGVPIVKVVDINLKNFIDKTADFALNDRDSISIIPLLSDLFNMVQLTGAVQYPGVYQSDSITLKKLIFDFGKPIPTKAYFKRADLIRRNQDLITSTVYPFDLEKLSSDPAIDRKLESGDLIIVYEKNTIHQVTNTVFVEGEVNNSGSYDLDTNMTVVDAILRAGGFMKAAFKTKVDVYRPAYLENGTLIQGFSVDLPDSLDFSEAHRKSFALRNGDRVIVRPDPYYYPDPFVTIRGAVRFQGMHALENRDVRLVDIIQKAGGLLPEAFLEGAVVTRGGKRMVVNFSNAYYKKSKRDNILLQKGDELFIPTASNTIYVHGQVNNSGLLSFSEGMRVDQYINRAGGLSDSVRYILVTKPNGETQKLGIHNIFKNPVVQDGSEIIVMKQIPKPEKTGDKGPSVAEVIRDTLAIITSAVTIIVLLSQVKN